ncbi:hypothetical protein MWU60_18100 [Yoonia sp. F2084L]|uniref:hypothetical protein n=1 Tax=Yoonia sp. F2084L TaxID=2926419 RepID=UPI001FF2CA61|nr:hypothetical protein [Yoonia sp. F2084L]MCK0097495.1 hypothetical protein [Yoonia sp. F2084L]
MSQVVDFRNESGLEFKDISSEQWREYTFSDGQSVRIELPLKLYVSENGHRLLDTAGVSHYIPLSWIHLKWQVKDGLPQFVL